ncbi:hydroxymethylglutaryl-CoA reductase, degradative [Agrococcus jejuensis]|uniref:3-hydroxy-3-methylglutaryl coenzyme A reductase n=1 Tax=Agrococcus jejuensis TaxID=399736 RepID=A0A1G8ECY0_9MICO|nr:hydroxymethylglutaryl-CoA reductase, degradative [Agrococcus jejuensis]SDH67743.1 3-hydroxy-3-methylglutaryl-coenzyme A reductase [Agrococcus jejuensis]
MARTSRLSGLRSLAPAERRAAVAAELGIGTDDLAAFLGGGIDLPQADRMVEHAIGTIGIPVGVATNLIVDGREVLVPMATEEPSVIAAASNVARMTRATGGFTTTTTGPLMQAQVQLLGVADVHAARARILEREAEVLELANAQDPRLVEHGGGARRVDVRIIHGRDRTHLVAHLVVDVRDAMGANAVNSMAEATAPLLASIAEGRHLLRILTNKADLRLARARVRIRPDDIGGPEVVANMLEAGALAHDDPYRAATHNKGIMNGVTAVVLATGNDTRAVEAGAHAHAARDGQYRSLSTWERDADGSLSATLELPMPVGLVGGATRSHPAAQAAVRMLEVTTADELARIVVSVGLAQNIGAVRALSAEGIQRGHMGLHARNVAVSAGASADEVDALAARIVAAGAVRADVAERELAALRASR